MVIFQLRIVTALGSTTLGVEDNAPGLRITMRIDGSVRSALRSKARPATREFERSLRPLDGAISLS